MNNWGMIQKAWYIVAWTCIVLFGTGFMADKPAYTLFDTKGKATNYQTLLRKASEADVVLFGELHGNPICHWLERELLYDLHQIKKEKLVVGAEMFEADEQIIVDEYLQGSISETSFENETKRWNNYNDYKPLLNFAKDHKLKFVASNIPRRYASMVAKNDLQVLEQINTQARQWIAPLPITVNLELPGYKRMVGAMGAHNGSANFAKAQAVKDATMAHFITKNLQKGQTLLHFNGSYHSNNYEGIVWYLKQQNPKIKILTIASVLQETEINRLDSSHIALADFIIVTPTSLMPGK